MSGHRNLASLLSDMLIFHGDEVHDRCPPLLPSQPEPITGPKWPKSQPAVQSGAHWVFSGGSVQGMASMAVQLRFTYTISTEVSA